jgi:hypothetical protein
MSDEKIDDLKSELDYLEEDVNYRSVRLRYNEILTLLSLNKKDDKNINYLLDILFDGLGMVLSNGRREKAEIDVVIMLYHNILLDILSSKDEKHFLENVPAFAFYLKYFNELKEEQEEDQQYDEDGNLFSSKKNWWLVSRD